MPKIDLRLWEIYLEVSEINLGASKMFRRGLEIPPSDLQSSRRDLRMVGPVPRRSARDLRISPPAREIDRMHGRSPATAEIFQLVPAVLLCPYGTGAPLSSTKTSKTLKRVGSGGTIRLAWLVTSRAPLWSSKAMLAGLTQGMGSGEPPGLSAGPE